MTAFNGQMHARMGATGMLVGEALLGLVFVVLGIAAVWKFSGSGSSLRSRTADLV